MRYLPLTETDEKKILETCQIEKFEELIESIPEELRFDLSWQIPEAKSEVELITKFKTLANENRARKMACFLGQGVYPHSSPAVIDHLVSRGEFLTAYTPYQPELSQGTLQSIFEFQSMIAELFEMEVSNASLYDGSTSVVEAVLMASRIKRAQKASILISEGVYVRTQKVLKTYLENLDLELVFIESNENFVIDESCLEKAKAKAKHPVVACVLQSPNHWGYLENWQVMTDFCEKEKLISIAYVPEAQSLGLIDPPGHFGVDIAAGEGQSLGLPMGYGGPYLGLLCCKKKYVRQMPGRLVGATRDDRGDLAFCVTLATREQHIRREKATSNICSNQNLMALRSAVFMSLMGPYGLKESAEQSHSMAVYAFEAISKIARGKTKIQIPETEFFNEFTIFYDEDAERFGHRFQKIAASRALLAGIWVEKKIGEEYKKGISLAFTEAHSILEIDKLIFAFKESLGELS